MILRRCELGKDAREERRSLGALEWSSCTHRGLVCAGNSTGLGEERRPKS